MRVVNFAHGEFYMVGGLLGWALTELTGLNFFLTLAVVVACLGAGGYLVDRFLMNRVRGQGEEPTILLTIGLVTLLASATQAAQEQLAQSITEARAEATRTSEQLKATPPLQELQKLHGLA